MIEYQEQIPPISLPGPVANRRPETEWSGMRSPADGEEAIQYGIDSGLFRKYSIKGGRASAGGMTGSRKHLLAHPRALRSIPAPLQWWRIRS